MLKRIFTGVICVTMMLTSGCALKDKIAKKIKSENDIEDVFEKARSNYNIELMEELIETGEISQDLLNSGLYNSYINIGNNGYKTMLYLIEKGADPNYHDMPQQFAYNGNIPQMEALLTSPDVDVNQKNELGHSVLYQAMINEAAGDAWISYNLTEMLLDKGAEIEVDFFINTGDTEDYRFGYNQIYGNPLAIRMLINKYTEGGNEVDIPEALKYALCGKIEECIKSIQQSASDLTLVDINVILSYALCFGTPDQYENLCELLNSDTNIVYRDIALCGNTEMLDYLFKKDNIELEVDQMDQEKWMHSNIREYSDCLDYAASFDEIDTCKFLIKKKIYPNLSAEYCPSLTSAICADDFELVELIYNYLNNNFGPLTEDQIANALLNVSKVTGYREINDYDKKVFDFFLEKGYTLNSLKLFCFSSEKVTYLINNGCELSQENLVELADNNDILSLKAAFEKGYKPDSEVLKTAVIHASSDTVKLILDNGAEMPDDIMEDAKYASKATVKVLIAAGAKTDLKFDRLEPADGGGLVQKGNFDLKDYYIHYGRDDLAKLL